MNTDIDKARVPSDRAEEHPTLFPLSRFSRPPRTAKAVCDEIGLNWFSAIKLHEEDWLSFDPQSAGLLTPAQEAELSFLGPLVAAGCDGHLMRRMLAGLKRPYAYRLDRMYYDWASRAWGYLEGEQEMREQFGQWIERLADAAELDKLERLRDRVEDAIRRLRREILRQAPW